MPGALLGRGKTPGSGNFCDHRAGIYDYVAFETKVAMAKRTALRANA
jgi:hypothetical protein